MANTFEIVRMATGVCAEVARIHIGRKRYDVNEVYRMFSSLYGGLGALIQH